MPNSLRSKLSKLRYKGEITQEEYAELIKKLDGHDADIEQNAYMRGYNQGYFKGESDGRFFSRVETIEEVIQKQRVIIDEDGVMYKVVFLKDIEDISEITFTEKDVVRHRLVQNIIKAYESYYEKKGKENGNRKSYHIKPAERN